MLYSKLANSFILQNGHFVIIDNKYKFPIYCFDFVKQNVHYLGKDNQTHRESFHKCKVMILEDFHKMTADVEFEPHEG